MTFCWSILGGLLLSSTRYLHNEWSHGMLIHTIIGLIIIALTYLMSFIMMDYEKEKLSIHDMMGFVTLGMTTLLGIGGFLT